jgi:hypothetical protein
VIYDETFRDNLLITRTETDTSTDPAVAQVNWNRCDSCRLGALGVGAVSHPDTLYVCLRLHYRR